MREGLKDMMKKGLFDPEALKRVNEMRKTWKYIPYNRGISNIVKPIEYEDKKEVSLHEGEKS